VLVAEAVRIESSDQAAAVAALRAAATVRRAFGPEHRQGFEPSVAEVLLALWVEGPLSTSDVASNLAMNRSTVAHAASLLRKQGLADTPPRPRHHLPITLTREGTRRAAMLARHIASTLR
jgi:DNA-binding MarR family transcriptional regulator